MDALVEELLRLENSKHTALILIDPAAYDATVQEQMQLLANTKETVRTVTNVARLLALSQLITLNTRLLHNLMATTPVFTILGNEYRANGRMFVPRVPRRMSVEA